MPLQGDGNLFLGSGKRCEFDRFLEGLAQIEFNLFDPNLAGLDLGVVEDVIDELEEGLGRGGGYL